MRLLVMYYFLRWSILLKWQVDLLHIHVFNIPTLRNIIMSVKIMLKSSPQYSIMLRSADSYFWKVMDMSVSKH